MKVYPYMILLAGLYVGCSTPEQKTATEVPPNVIIIFTDDQGYSDVGVYGAERFETPHLDKMAEGGKVFTDFYSANPVCSPSRAALLTGCYPTRVGVNYVYFPEGPEWSQNSYFKGLHPEEVTIADMLREVGYATGCVGKWHLGHFPEFLPTAQGFDYYYGIPYSNDMRPENSLEYPPLPLIENDGVVMENPDQRQLTKWYTEKATEFINKHADEPFFLYLAHSMPHVPLYASEEHEGSTTRGLYGDVISEIDWSVGQIMETLEWQGLLHNTLVIFTSDNGPWLVKGADSGSASPLRGGKMTTFEGGQRVPCIVHWPDKVAAGSRSETYWSTIDFLPTIASIANATLPENKIDGRDATGLLVTDTIDQLHEEFFFIHRGETQAVRSGNWKLHVPHNYVAVVPSDTSKTGKIAVTRQEELALYDLKEDPGEQQNLAAQYPEVVSELKNKLAAFDSLIKVEARPEGAFPPVK